MRLAIMIVLIGLFSGAEYCYYSRLIRKSSPSCIFHYESEFCEDLSFKNYSFVYNETST
jgi:hypothetical protein